MTSKYGNVKTDGYDSKAQAFRGYELELLERAGKVRMTTSFWLYLWSVGTASRRDAATTA